MTTVWDAEVLETKRQTADPLADELVAAVLDQGESDTWQVTRLFAAMARNDSPIPDQLPAAMQAYFADTHLPPWADREKIRRGERLFGTYGVEIVLLLFCKALPLTYCCWRGAEVLIKTGRMTEQTLKKGEKFTVINRRIMETAQFVLNVMAPGGFELNGRGLRTAQKIRLIHACIRHFLLQQDWDKDNLGLPINQEDLAGTLMAFSYCMVEGLEQLGLKVSSADREAYLHCWKVVGHFIGLDDDLMPADFASSRQLTETILAGQCGPALAGTILTKSLVDYMGSKMPFGFGRSVPPLLIRELIGDTRADYLGVRRVPAWETWLVKYGFKFFFTAVTDGEKCLPWHGLLARCAARELLQLLIKENNHYKHVEFYLPPSLREDWNV